MKVKAEILDNDAIIRTTSRMCYEIIERNRGVADLCIIGIYMRGAVLATRISKEIAQITARDINTGFIHVGKVEDYSNINYTNEIKTDIPFSVNGMNVILVDDIIQSGRISRIALERVLKLGNPSTIQIAALVDTNKRELPVRADYVGKLLPISDTEWVKVYLSETDGINKVIILDNDQQARRMKFLDNTDEKFALRQR